MDYSKELLKMKDDLIKLATAMSKLMVVVSDLQDKSIMSNNILKDVIIDVKALQDRDS